MTTLRTWLGKLKTAEMALGGAPARPATRKPSDPWKAGYRAFLCGKSRYAVYYADQERTELWIQGFEAAQQERRAHGKRTEA